MQNSASRNDLNIAHCVRLLCGSFERDRAIEWCIPQFFGRFCGGSFVEMWKSTKLLLCCTTRKPNTMDWCCACAVEKLIDLVCFNGSLYLDIVQ